nr:hypothetical protein [Actinomycetota bacterium]
TLAHVVDCLFWYASNLARRSATHAGSPDVAETTPLDELVDSLRSGAALLALAVDATDADGRGFHPFGMADASGFAAMGVDEMLVHGYDLAAGLGLGASYSPPTGAVERTLRRLFPWAPTVTDPWDTLLWANGRRPLGEESPDDRWLWHCAPLAEWDGTVRRVP